MILPGLDLAPLLRSLSSIFLFWAARFCLCFSSISRLCWSSLCCLMLADGMFSILTTVNNINFYHDLTMKHQTLIFYTDKSRSILRMCLWKKASALVSHLPSNHRNTEISMQKNTKNVKWNGKGDITDQTTHRTQNQAEMRDEERIKQWIMKTYFLLAADSDGSNWGSQTWPDMIIRTPCTSLILYRTPFTPLFAFKSVL